MEHSAITETSITEDTFQDFITDDMRRVIQLTNYVILCGIISLFGTVTNIANILVFVRQRFKDSINISLLGLSIADLLCSVTMLWTSTCYNPLFQNVDLPIVYLDVMYVTGGWPHVCFNRITSFITAFITLERCLCIAMPLKVKNVITHSRTRAIIVSIFVSMIILFTPFYFVNKLQWQFNDLQNSSVLGLTFTDNREIVDSITFFIHSVALPIILLITVAICTIILVVKLNRTRKWRKESVAMATSKQETGTLKDKKVVKMITLISTIFVTCYVPPTINFITMSTVPDFSITGKYKNRFFVAWSIAFVLETVNSSVNIIIYLKMSSKFKHTFIGIFCGSRKHLDK